MTRATKVGIGVALAVCAGGLWWGASQIGGSEPAGAPPAPAGDADSAEAPRLAARPEPQAARPVAARKIPKQAPVLPGWERRSIGRIQLDVPQAWSEQPGPRADTATWSPIRPEDHRIAFGVLPSDGLASMSRDELVASTSATVDGRASRRDEYDHKGDVGVAVSFTEGDPPVVLVMRGPKATWDVDRVVLERILATVRVLPPAAAVGPGSESEAPTAAYLQSLETPVTGPAVEGIVLRGARPAAGVAVDLRAEGSKSSPLQRAVTATNGVFRFEGVDRGAYALDVATGTDTRLEVHTSMVPDVPRTRLVVLLGPGAIEGVAYDRLGKPAIGRRVDASGFRGFPRDVYLAVTRGDGSFRLDALPAGEWPVSLHLAAAREGSADVRDVRGEAVTLTWGETKHVDLGAPTLEPLVTGRVRTVGGAGVAGPSIHLAFFERVAGKSSVGVALDEEGRFAQRLPAGDYEVRVTGFALQRTQVLTKTVGSADVAFEITLDAPSVLGRVFDLATRAPAARAVEWTPIVVLEPAKGGGLEVTTTAPDGTFAFHCVAPGSYLVHAELGPPDDARRRSESTAIEVPAGHDVSGVQLDLPAK